MTPVNIVVLVAGTNEPSNSNMLADTFVQGMQQIGDVTVQKRRLKDLKIEHFTLDFYQPQCHQEEDFCMLQRLIQEADGLVIATPVWNFSIPGHLKNLIDRMGSFALDETRSKGTLGGKPFYIIFTGGTPMPVWTGLMKKTTSSVPQALVYFGGTHMGTYFEPKCTKGMGVFGLVVDERPESLATVRKKGYGFAMVVKEFSATGKLPIGKQIFRVMYNWGAAVVKRL